MYEPILVILKPALGAYVVPANYTVAYEETQSNQVSDYCGFVCSLFPEAFFFLLLFYSTVVVVVPCGGRKQSPCTSS